MMLISEMSPHVLRNPLRLSRLKIMTVTYGKINVLPCNDMRSLDPDKAKVTIVQPRDFTNAITLSHTMTKC